MLLFREASCHLDSGLFRNGFGETTTEGKNMSKNPNRKSRLRKSQTKKRVKISGALPSLEKRPPVRLTDGYSLRKKFPDGGVGTIGHLLRLDLSPWGTEENQVNLLRELARLGRASFLLDYEERTLFPSWFLHPSILPRVREIGEALEKLDTDSDREDCTLLWFFSCDLLSFPREAHRSIEMAWDGLGKVLA